MTAKSLQVSNIHRSRFWGVLEVRVDGCETVRDLKKCIAFQNNLAVVKVMYRGARLQDAKRLHHFLIPDLRMGPPGFSVHTRVRSRPMPGARLCLHVVVGHRKIFPVYFHSLDCTIFDLKEAIRHQSPIPIHHEMRVIRLEGKLLTDDATLRDCDVETGCRIHLELGTSESPPRFELRERPKHGSMTRMRLNNKAPVWRSAGKGLGVEGKCRNRTCRAYGEMVICNLGFTAFNLAEEEGVRCPVCETRFRALTCGFRECTWMFEGRKAGLGSVDVKSQWMVAGFHYERFNDMTSTAEWKSLVVIAKELLGGGSNSNQAPEDQTEGCPICYEALEGSSPERVAACRHTFHEDCVAGWEELEHTTCPKCKNPLRT